MERLEENVGSDDFYEISHAIVQEIETSKTPFVFVEPILNLIENNPKTDFGLPGPLVHFVEKFYKDGYEELLIASAKRHPTSHNVWMINRIINGSDSIQREKYVQVLKEIADRDDINIEIKEQITFYLN